MLLEIDHHCGIPIYRQVIDHVRGQVMAGRFAAGQQLEPVRELAGRLKVNPMTISKAYSLPSESSAWSGHSGLILKRKRFACQTGRITR